MISMWGCVLFVVAGAVIGALIGFCAGLTWAFGRQYDRDEYN